MSFLSVLHTIQSGVEKGVGIASSVAPFIGLIPGVGQYFPVVLHVVVTVEALIKAPNSGPARKETAMLLLKYALPGVDQAALGAQVDKLVAGLNLLQESGEGIAALAKAVPAPVAVAPV